MVSYSNMLILLLLSFHNIAISAVQITVGTSSLDGVQDKCTNVQEFSCVSDVCDPFPSVRCRNGDNPTMYCAPNTSCAQPTAGHCLEDTITAGGIHSMPDASHGTPKHFSCLSVQNFDTPVVVWETATCTGKSCFIPSAGEYLTWQSGAQGNCVDIGVEVPVQTVPCLAAGQGSAAYPSGGGFPQGQNLEVGGDYGMPVAFDNSNTCTAYTNSPPPAAIPVNSTNPPIADIGQKYSSGQPDTSDPDIVDKRDIVLYKRANQYTAALREAFDYAANWQRDGAAVGQRLWYFIDNQGHLRAWIPSPSRIGLNADHVVELNMIISFFGVRRDSPISNALGIPNNVWSFIWSFIRSKGLAPVGGASCDDYKMFAKYVGGDGNMCGIDARVNALKGVVIDALLRTATPVVSSYTRIEAQGALEFVMFGAMQASEAAHDIGNFLGGLVSADAAQLVSDAFKTFTENTFNAAVHWLSNAVNQPRGYFLGE